MSESEYGKLGARIIASLEEAIRHARGEDTGARVRVVEVTGRRKPHLEQPPFHPPYLVCEIREKLAVSQTIFAQMLGVSPSTVRAWEQGKREPEGAAARLLQLAHHRPDVLVEICGPIIDADDDQRPLPRAIKAPAAGPERLAAEREAS